MENEVGTQLDGLKVVPVTAPSPLPSPIGEGARSSAERDSAAHDGGEPVQTEAKQTPGAAFDPDAFLAQIQGVLDERDRRLQSSLDKRDGHIRKMLAERQGQVNAIGEKAKGLGMPDQQVQALQSALLNDALAEALKDETPELSPQPSPKGEGAELAVIAQAEAKAEAMAELAGLTADDPEVKLIAGYATPAEYLEKVREACAAKLKRTLAPSPQPSRGSAVGTSVAMGPVGSAANLLPPIERVDTGRLWREALQEARDNRG